MANPRPTTKRTTVYLRADIARAAKLKAAISGKTMSDLANEGLARLLREDARDLKIFRQRAKDKTRSYDEFIAELEKRGEI